MTSYAATHRRQVAVTVVVDPDVASVLESGGSVTLQVGH